MRPVQPSSGKASDTLEPLQAVLNTNFWLSIHVTSINIGYAAGEWMADYATKNNLTEDETVGVLYMTMNTTSSCHSMRGGVTIIRHSCVQ